MCHVERRPNLSLASPRPRCKFTVNARETTFTLPPMASMTAPRKPRAISTVTGLAYGEASKIARIHRMSAQHVIEVAAGRRFGRPELVRTIIRFQAKHRHTVPKWSVA